MSMTLEQSQEQYKKAIIENRKPRYTDSPVKNLTTKEKVDFVRNNFGNEEARKTAEEELKKKLYEEKITLQESDIVNKTNHLPNYEYVKNTIALQGEEYVNMIKEIYKLLISLAVPEHLRVIKIGEIETDLRVHPNIILSSGKGKKNIGEAVKRIYKNFKSEANIKEPRTIHYQHLIGKMLLRKEEEEIGTKKDGTPKIKKVDKWIPKYGFLNADLLILEEAYELFNSQEKNDVDCRDALLVAMDCHGKNLIQKQNMDNLDTKEETLQYYPYVCVLDFLQPLMLNESFVTKGVARRLHTCYRDFPERTKLDKYVSRLTTSSSDFESAKLFSDYMHQINNVRTKWELSSDCVETFTICHAGLLEQGFRKGGKVAHYTRMLEFPMQNLLLKMSALQALSNLRTKITKQDVQNAYVDIIERLVYEFNYIEKKVKGTLDYGESWAGATGKVQQCLEELYNFGAVSRETSIPIWQFQKVIEKIYDISNRRAKDRYKEMKANELISDYLGQGKDNGVWLNFEPKIRNPEDVENDELLNPKRLYLEFSAVTDKSGMTPKTGIPLIIKTELPSSIDSINDKTIKTDTSDVMSQVNKKVVKSQKVINTPLRVIPVTADTSQPEISNQKISYKEAPECANIQPCNKQEVLDYIKSNPKSQLPELLGKFGAGVMDLKRRGLL
jgi:hypothetical protein